MQPELTALVFVAIKVCVRLFANFFICLPGINNNAYTNAIVSVCLEFAIEAALELGVSYPPTWKQISQSMYIPFLSSMNMHPEYQGYQLKQIVKQVS